jgi:hypothetical protein
MHNITHDFLGYSTGVTRSPAGARRPAGTGRAGWPHRRFSTGKHPLQSPADTSTKALERMRFWSTALRRRMAANAGPENNPVDMLKRKSGRPGGTHIIVQNQ